MNNMLYDFEHIQDKSWGWGVFYPWDSNSVDFRCEWRGGVGFQGYDCPGGWKPAGSSGIQQNGTFFGEAPALLRPPSPLPLRLFFRLAVLSSRPLQYPGRRRTAGV